MESFRWLIKQLRESIPWLFSGIGNDAAKYIVTILISALISLWIYLSRLTPWGADVGSTVQFIKGSDNALIEVTKLVEKAESRIKVLSYGLEISKERETLFSAYTDAIADRLNTHENLQYQVLITRKKESLSEDEIQFVEDRVKRFSSKIQRGSKQILYRHKQPSSPGFFLFIVDNKSLLMGFSTLEGEAAPTIPRYCIKITDPKDVILEISNLYDNLWEKAEGFIR